MVMYENQKGIVKSEDEWKHDCNTMWKEFKGYTYVLKQPKPIDAWERFKRVLQLKEVDHQAENYSFTGIF